MRLVITGDNEIARAALSAFAGEAETRSLTADALLDLQRVADAVAGCDALLHFAPLDAPDSSELVTLDRAGRGTYNAIRAAIEAGVQRVIVGSSLTLFDSLPQTWRIDPSWRPRPQPILTHLACWLAELCVREASRVVPVRGVCLRFGRTNEEDTANALQDALTETEGEEAFWRIRHVGERTGSVVDDGRNWRDMVSPAAPTASRPIERVVVFGAGGPVSAAAVKELAGRYTLRLTDLRDLAEIAAENKPQTPGAPVAAPLAPPHETRIVDVRDPAAVESACEGMDAILNLSVVRPDPIAAFEVNMLGAYNIARAAVRHNIRRIVHTGPQFLALDRPVGYWSDYDVPGDAPARPGLHLYGQSKYLGQEILRVFADHYGLEVPCLLFNIFVNVEVQTWQDRFAVSWADSARALRRALEVESLPSPFEVLHVMADQPHGVFSPRLAQEVLGWTPQDDLRELWRGA